MQNVMQWLGNRLGALLSAVSAIEGGDAEQASKPQVSARTRITVIGLVYTLIIGAIDAAATKGMSLDFFYLLGCAFVGWAGGARPATVITLVVGIFTYLSGVHFTAAGIPLWVVYWNSLIRILSFMAVGWLAAEVGRLTRSLERTVQERTSRLRSEVEEHKETSARLRETLVLFRQVTENITEVFWVTDPAKTRLNYVSRGFERVWGQQRQVVYTQPSAWLDAVDTEDRERVTQATYTKQIVGEYDEEYRVRRPDGSVCWVHDRAFPVRNEDGEVYRIVGITEDITEHKRSQQLLEAQRDIAAALSATNDLSAALEHLLETATEVEGLDCGGVYLVNPENGDLELEAHLGLSPSFVEEVARYQAGSSEARLAKEGRVLYPVCGPDWNTEGSFWTGEKLRSLAVIPLRHEGEVLGALTLGSHAHDEIAAPIRVAIETIAAQAAGAIARIRLERQILEISDREQARIGQDIHDGLCQQLIGLAFTANGLASTMVDQSYPEAPTARRICTLLDEAITESRNVCRGLYPVRLKTEGLVPALEELAHTVAERFNIHCSCEADTRRVHCDVTTATHLYRIAQEAVNNAIKHSGGRNVLIRLADENGSIELRITDDGKGLKNLSGRPGGMGLHIMDYRARSVGGDLSIRSEPGETAVICKLSEK
jgi:PAS domain S-box-containing protein